MLRSRRLQRVAVVLALLTTGLATLAEQTEEQSPNNVLVTIRAGHIDGGSRIVDQTYRIIAPPDGRRVKLVAGTRLPIAVTKCQASTPPNREIFPMTSYVYQEVGFIAGVETRVGENRRIHIDADLERSEVAGETADGSPTIDTEHQSIRTVVEDGTSLEVLRITDEPSGKTVYYEIEASIQ
jgi:hypothetical protein